MQLKSFIAGTIVGIALTVFAVLLLDQSEANLDSMSRQVAADSDVETTAIDQTASRTAIPQAVSVARDTSEVVAANHEFDERATDISDDSLAPAGLASGPMNQIPVTDFHRQLIENTSGPDPESSGPGSDHRKLEDERRDHDWSYFMEQSIGLFLGSHSEIAHFDIARIECRTTMCEIQSFGVDENAGPRWGLIIHDLRNQPWSDFGQTGSSSSTIDGRLVIITHLRRVIKPD